METFSYDISKRCTAEEQLISLRKSKIYKTIKPKKVEIKQNSAKIEVSIEFLKDENTELVLAKILKLLYANQGVLLRTVSPLVTKQVVKGLRREETTHLALCAAINISAEELFSEIEINLILREIEPYFEFPSGEMDLLLLFLHNYTLFYSSECFFKSKCFELITSELTPALEPHFEAICSIFFNCTPHFKSKWEDYFAKMCIVYQNILQTGSCMANALYGIKLLLRTKNQLLSDIVLSTEIFKLALNTICTEPTSDQLFENLLSIVYFTLKHTSFKEEILEQFKGKNSELQKQIIRMMPSNQAETLIICCKMIIYLNTVSLLEPENRSEMLDLVGSSEIKRKEGIFKLKVLFDLTFEDKRLEFFEKYGMVDKITDHLEDLTAIDDILFVLTFLYFYATECCQAKKACSLQENKVIATLKEHDDLQVQRLASSILELLQAD